MNHFAHSEVTRTAKGVEVTLREKLENMELSVSKLETDLRQCVAYHPYTWVCNLTDLVDKYVIA
jgi:hypothetical protein